MQYTICNLNDLDKKIQNISVFVANQNINNVNSIKKQLYSIGIKREKISNLFLHPSDDWYVYEP